MPGAVRLAAFGVAGCVGVVGCGAPAPLPSASPARPSLSVDPAALATPRQIPPRDPPAQYRFDESVPDRADAAPEPVDEPVQAGDQGGTPDMGTPLPPPPPPPLGPPPASAPAGGMVVPFGPDIERPRKISGPDPAYTPEARAAGVEGKVLTRCVVSVQGTLTDCRILKSLPMLDDAVLAALSQQRWAPATYAGQPVAVAYTIPYVFRLR